jgi:hypothetical protein
MWRGDESRKGDTETPNTFLLMPKLCAKRETGMYGTNQIRLVLIRCVCCEKWQVVRLDPDLQQSQGLSFQSLPAFPRHQWYEAQRRHRISPRNSPEGIHY